MVRARSEICLSCGVWGVGRVRNGGHSLLGKGGPGRSGRAAYKSICLPYLVRRLL